MCTHKHQLSWTLSLRLHAILLAPRLSQFPNRHRCKSDIFWENRSDIVGNRGRSSLAGYYAHDCLLVAAVGRLGDSREIRKGKERQSFIRNYS